MPFPAFPSGYGSPPAISDSDISALLPTPPDNRSHRPLPEVPF